MLYQEKQITLQKNSFRFNKLSLVIQQRIIPHNIKVPLEYFLRQVRFATLFPPQMAANCGGFVSSVWRVSLQPPPPPTPKPCPATSLLFLHTLFTDGAVFLPYLPSLKLPGGRVSARVKGGRVSIDVEKGVLAPVFIRSTHNIISTLTLFCCRFNKMHEIKWS